MIRAERIVLSLNIAYYAQLGILLCLICSFDFVATKFFIPYALLLKFYSALILVISIQKLRNTMRGIDKPGFFGREQLMFLHSFLFISYILMDLIASISSMATIHYRTLHE